MSGNRKDRPQSANPYYANPDYGGKEFEILSQTPANPLPTGFNRRAFLKGMTAAAAGGAMIAGQAGAVQTVRSEVPGEQSLTPPEKEVPNNILAQCPYCGVGCGTLILIALIVLFFSRPGITELQSDIRSLRRDVTELRKTLKSQAVDLRAIRKTSTPASDYLATSTR